MGTRSFLTDALLVGGVWTFSAFFFSGIAGAIALILGRSRADIAHEFTHGGIAGFIIGFPIAIATAILLAVSS